MQNNEVLINSLYDHYNLNSLNIYIFDLKKRGEIVLENYEHYIEDIKELSESDFHKTALDDYKVSVIIEEALEEKDQLIWDLKDKVVEIKNKQELNIDEYLSDFEQLKHYKKSATEFLNNFISLKKDYTFNAIISWCNQEEIKRFYIDSITKFIDKTFKFTAIERMHYDELKGIYLNKIKASSQKESIEKVPGGLFRFLSYQETTTPEMLSYYKQYIVQREKYLTVLIKISEHLENISLKLEELKIEDRDFRRLLYNFKQLNFYILSNDNLKMIKESLENKKDVHSKELYFEICEIIKTPLVTIIPY